MAKIALIGCTKRKKDNACRAEELYSKSDLFCKELIYARHVLDVDAVYVLSAKHGLVSIDMVLEPYDETLNTAKVAQRRLWANMVAGQIEESFCQEDELWFLCGRRYREYLLPLIQEKGYVCHVALPQLAIGKLKNWLNTEIGKIEV